MTTQILHVNGAPATIEQLGPVAFAGYAHFTAMQVRDRSVRGLDRHLARLRGASDELFGNHVSEALISGYLRAAIAAGPPDSSVTVFVSSGPGEFLPADPHAGLDVLVRVSAPAVPPSGPLRLDVAVHERVLPHVKHVGEIAKTLFLRAAVARGFDDAAFADRSGRLSEATIWNLAFWDGESVIWPRADLLPGVTMQIVSRRLTARGVPQLTREIRPEALTTRHSAVLMNSWTPAIPVASVGEQQLEVDPDLVALLHAAYESEPAHRV